MLCCGQCFQDRWLQDQLIPRLSKKSGQCPTCSEERQLLVEAKLLGDFFEPLCGIYVAARKGKVLVDRLIEDWLLFSIKRDRANTLLAEILDDGERVRRPLVPSSRCKTDTLTRWEQLRQELRHRNRFFPKTPIDAELFEGLLSGLVLTLEPDEWSWFRARIQKRDRPYPPAEMGPPPKTIATHGRASPAGIPYLYLASDASTAIAEVRPHPGEIVCVAGFEIGSSVSVADLRHPRRTISPFEFGDDPAPLLGNLEFLERLGSELTTPVLPNAAAIEYIPSQYLCEFIKKCGYAGVLYSSSVSDGVNLALFNPSDASVGEVQQFAVESVTVQTSEIHGVE